MNIINKILNIVSSVLFIVGWLIVLCLVGIIDVLQLDALSDQEITGTFYLAASAGYLVLYYLLKKTDAIDDIDFD